MKNKWDIDAWLQRTQNVDTLMDTLYELNGGDYESIPDDIQEGWDNLSKYEKIEVVNSITYYLL